MQAEQRNERRYKAQNHRVTIFSNNTKQAIGVLKDVSSGGLQASFPLEHKDKLQAEEDYKFVVGRNSWRGRSITKREDAKAVYMNVQFAKPVTDRELAPHVDNADWTDYDNNSTMLDMAKSDLSEVREELRQIRGCRSNIFIGTLGATVAGVITAGAIFAQLMITTPVQSNLHIPALWASFSSITVLLLLGTGILATIEKGRAISYREGFCSALSEYLVHGITPKGYFGWQRLKQILYINHKENYELLAGSLAIEPDKLSPKDPSLWLSGKQRAKLILDQMRLFSKPFDSFMSFSTYIYTCTYMIIFSVLATSVAVYLAIRSGTPENYFYYYWGIALGAVVLSIVTGDMILYRKKNAEDNYVLIWFRRIVWFGSLAAGLIFLIFHASTNNNPISPTAAYLTYGGIILSFSYWGTYLLYQFKKLRKGKFSPHAMHMSWQIIFERSLSWVSAPGAEHKK